jgi:two-component system, OmpR family, sensor kinase
MSLRRRLLLVLLTLSAAGLLTAGVASATLLRKSLIRQKDEQLTLLAQRGLDRGRGRGPNDATGQNGTGGRTRPSIGTPASDPGHDDVPGAADVTGANDGPVGYVTDAYTITGERIGSQHNATSADKGGGPVVTLDELVEHAPGRPFTRPAINGRSSYRVLARGVVSNGAVIGFFTWSLELNDVDQTIRQFIEIETIVGALALLVIGTATWFLVRSSLRPLERMTATAVAIADGDFTARVEGTDGKTEVGRLGGAFNTMIGRIEASFAERNKTENRLRRFVGDASHELRTPLTSIRGYAELVRSGALADDAGRALALGRIESEASRMGLLVEDLLLLARLDQGRPLANEPLDLTRVARANVDDARTCEPDRLWSYTGSGPITVLGDADRLHQVISNLVTNARSHTPVGTAVETAVVIDGNSAVLTVRDHGPGFPADEADRIFERFARLDEGRARSDGGTGLGLAIVRAIVEAHHGHISASNAADGGAVFTLRLPLAPTTPVAPGVVNDQLPIPQSPVTPPAP